MMALEGRRIAVTGAASGMGRATVALLHSAGAEVFALDIRPAETGCSRFIPIDLLAPASIAAATAQLPASLDGLCNIAGLALPHAPIDILGANLIGPRLLTEALLERFPAGATIVNIASSAAREWRCNLPEVEALLAIRAHGEIPGAWARLGLDDQQSYRASKEALLIWSLQVSRDLLSRGVRVNVVSPGLTETPMMAAALYASGARGAEARRFAPRIAAPGEIAAVIAFLCSPASVALNAAHIAADGGLTAALDLRDHGMIPQEET